MREDVCDDVLFCPSVQWGIISSLGAKELSLHLKCENAESAGTNPL